MSKQLTPRLNRLEPNIIIDGGMEIWPEGNSRSVANNTSAYGAVLFKTANTSTGVTLTNSRQASIPSNTELTFSNQVSKTAAGTLAAGTISALQYTIEGYDLSKMFRGETSLIFWAKSSVASNRGLSIQNGSASHAYVQQYAINQINTWELKVIKLPAMNTCPGALDRANGAGATLIFSIVSGSNFQTSTLNSWVAGPKFSGIGEDTTWLTGTTHDFNIAGVMLLPGDWTALETNTDLYRFLRAGRTFQDEVAMSQRYYEKSYSLDTSPGALTEVGAYQWQSNSLGDSFDSVMYKVSKRTAATITSYNPVTGASGGLRAGGNNALFQLVQTAENSFAFREQDGSGEPASSFNGRVQWTADARF